MFQARMLNNEIGLLSYDGFRCYADIRQSIEPPTIDTVRDVLILQVIHTNPLSEHQSFSEWHARLSGNMWYHGVRIGINPMGRTMRRSEHRLCRIGDQRSGYVGRKLLSGIWRFHMKARRTYCRITCSRQIIEKVFRCSMGAKATPHENLVHRAYGEHTNTT